jgi:hypothetical protein
MSNLRTPREPEDEIESALLDADLFLKYQSPERAFKRLQSAIERHPRSMALRERMREVATLYKRPDEAARQCLALAGLHLAHENLKEAHDYLLEAKNLDPRISIASGLEAIRRARRPDLAAHPGPAPLSAAAINAQAVTLAGDFSAISIFDVVQVIENSRLTGSLDIDGGNCAGRVLFNEGQIVGAEAQGKEGEAAFRRIVEVTSGYFNFKRSAEEFPVTINTSSNTSLILETLRQLDEEKSSEESQ